MDALPDEQTTGTGNSQASLPVQQEVQCGLGTKGLGSACGQHKQLGMWALLPLLTMMEHCTLVIAAAISSSSLRMSSENVQSSADLLSEPM